LVILCPPGSWALLTVGLPAHRAGPGRGFRVPHVRAAIGVGALSTPPTTAASTVAPWLAWPVRACRNYHARYHEDPSRDRQHRVRGHRHGCNPSLL
jgi:hypothetical protein